MACLVLLRAPRPIVVCCVSVSRSSECPDVLHWPLRDEYSCSRRNAEKISYLICLDHHSHIAQHLSKKPSSSPLLFSSCPSNKQSSRLAQGNSRHLLSGNKDRKGEIRYTGLRRDLLAAYEAGPTYCKFMLGAN